MKIDSKILICYNSPVSIFSVYNGKPDKTKRQSKGFQNDLSESSFSKEIVRVTKSLEKNFTDVKSLAVNGNIERVIKKINEFSPDAIFNFVEAIEGVASYEYCMTGIYELLGFQYTGNTPSVLGNCLNKARTKNILRSFNINTPKYITITPKEKIEEKNFRINFPVILKLLNEDASIGISEFSVVNNFKELKKHLNFLFKTYKQEVIIEEFIEGRELNIAVLGDKILPISEIKFTGLPKDLPKIVTYESKWIENSIYYQNTKPQCPAKIDKNVKKKIERAALDSFNALNCRDYARVDIRLKNKTPYVIEVNPNPDISIDSGFARAAAAAGLEHSDLLFTIASFALNRKENDTKIKAS